MPAARRVTFVSSVRTRTSGRTTLRAKLALATSTAALLIGAAGAGAQTIDATNYPFSSAAGIVLEDLSSGTTQLVAANLDDTASAVTPIGFDFWLLAERLTQFSVNANGLARLGPVAVSGSCSAMPWPLRASAERKCSGLRWRTMRWPSQRPCAPGPTPA